MTREADALQYGSLASYGTALSGCDTNAARFTTVADMQRWILTGEQQVTPEEIDAVATATATKVNAHVDSALGYLYGGLAVGDNSAFKGGTNMPDLAAQFTALAGNLADTATHDEIAVVLAAIASQPAPTVDVQALAGLLSASLLAALPVDLAKQVADELHNRLES